MNARFKAYLLMTMVAISMCTMADDSESERQMRMRRHIEQEGGLVMRRTPGGLVRVVLAQERLDEHAVDVVIRQMQGLLDREVELGKMQPRGSFHETVDAVMGLPDTAIAIVLLEDKFLPTVLVAPEQGWAIINVKALAKDGQVANRLAERVRKELWRALVWVLAESHDTGCVMRHAENLVDLDAITTLVPSPDPMFRLVNGAARRKLRTMVRSTYRDALEEGWAPPPTNGIQKAIWEKFHAEKERGPSHPITIQPPKTKK
ncbi:MAG: hypothetical protein IKO72_01660 [Kiritimatiellae bacterium]|nr:hypothetical protein [Kiritimatiellia bacterium]